jgi:hypothetical protein
MIPGAKTGCIILHFPAKLPAGFLMCESGAVEKGRANKKQFPRRGGNHAAFKKYLNKETPPLTRRRFLNWK